MCVCEWIIKSEFFDQQDYASHWGGSEGHRRSCHLSAFSIYVWWRTSLAFILSDTHMCYFYKWNRKSLLFIEKLPFCLSLGVCVFQGHFNVFFSSGAIFTAYMLVYKYTWTNQWVTALWPAYTHRHHEWNLEENRGKKCELRETDIPIRFKITSVWRHNKEMNNNTSRIWERLKMRKMSKQTITAHSNSIFCIYYSLIFAFTCYMFTTLNLNQ